MSLSVAAHQRGASSSSQQCSPEDLWRECVQWLIRLNVGLTDQHPVAQRDASLADLAHLLRDGVLLCQVANRLVPNCIDHREIQRRPQLSQFLCLKNICQFLGACQETFSMNKNDLFEAWELYKVVEFGKVLLTLSRLSHTPMAVAAGVEGFPPLAKQHIMEEREYYNDDIYRNLAEEADKREIAEHDEVYDVHDDAVEDYGKIYDFVVTQGLYDRHKPSGASSTSAAAIARRASSRSTSTNSGTPFSFTDDFQPKDKRDYCIKELLETERNYVEALNMLLTQFFTPLRDVLNDVDHEMIFINLQQLGALHTMVHSALAKAVRAAYEPQHNPPPAGVHHQSIGDVFTWYKLQFLAYSEYCSRLPKAQTYIDQLRSASLPIRLKVQECEQNANERRFRLNDLLSLPYQRVLKYPLLLGQLIKLTSPDHPDYASLDKALDAMEDVAQCINEVKRDTETLAEMEAIARSIHDLHLPRGTHIIDYGRRLKDDEVRVFCQSDGNKWKMRYIFVFERVLIACKSLKNNQYAYKYNLAVGEYELVEEDVESGKASVGALGALLRSAGRSLPHSWLLMHHDQSNAVIMQAKSLELKNSWLKAIKQAQETITPPAIRNSEHALRYATFDNRPTVCTHCSRLLRGLFYQGYVCAKKECGVSLHKACIAHSTICTGGRHKETVGRFNRVHVGLVGQRLRALRSFHRPTDPTTGEKLGAGDTLSLDEHDLVEVMNVSTDRENYLKGRVVEGVCSNRIGIFPVDLVQQRQMSVPSAPSAPMNGVSRRGPSRADTFAGPSEAHQPQRGTRQPVPQLPRHTSQPMRRPDIVDGREVASPRSPARPLSHGPSPPVPPRASQVMSGYDNVDQLDAYPWYTPDIDRDTAELRLAGLSTGTFLVRFSPRQGTHAVSLAHKSEVKHLKIEQSVLGYWLDEATKFGSIVHLINYYRTHNLRECFNLLDTTLRKAFCEAVISEAVALYPYAAKADNELSLGRGDTVFVLNKTSGNERGWWKGKVNAKIGYFPLKFIKENRTFQAEDATPTPSKSVAMRESLSNSSIDAHRLQRQSQSISSNASEHVDTPIGDAVTSPDSHTSDADDDADALPHALPAMHIDGSSPVHGYNNEEEGGQRPPPPKSTSPRRRTPPPPPKSTPFETVITH